MKILLLEPLHDDARLVLAEVGDVVMAAQLESASLEREIADADAALTRGYGRLPRSVLSAGRKLRCVARCGVGTDNIDVAAATEMGLPVIYAPGSTTTAVAEHVMMLMLAVARRVTIFNREVKSGNWSFRAHAGLNRELKGKVLGILGLGDIGRRVAELAQAFEMDVYYWSKHSRDARWRYLERDELLRRSDILSINVALTPETRRFINRDALALMKSSAIIINTARGDVIDEAALYEALAAGRLGGAGLDVISADSPHENNPLWTLDNVVVTPHVAAVSDVAFRKMCLETAGQVSRILRGETPDPRFVRNPEVLKGTRA
ncbi:MAG: hydroxyacid dehydrogenase [Pyrinomonadaceae bacterium]